MLCPSRRRRRAISPSNESIRIDEYRSRFNRTLKIVCARIRRFKFVCNVTLVENSMQGFCAMYRCLWDKKFDKTAIYVYETPHLYAIATVHGLYFD